MYPKFKQRFSHLLVLWLIVTATYSYIHQRKFDNPMAASRLDLLHALISHHTFTIDTYHMNMPDKAIAHGHYFCDKAPGTVFLALPGFCLAAVVLPACGVSLESDEGWFLSSWICSASSIGIITSFGIVCLFLWLRNFIPYRCALISSLVIAFGSMAFPYVTMLMSHGVVVGLFSIALWCLRLTVVQDQPERKSRLLTGDLAAGAACGMGIACEYSAALVAGGILAVVGFSNWKRASTVILGAVPPLLLIPIYNWICLGSPFSLTYSHEALFTQNHSGFYGIHWPDPDNLSQLLLSPRQGLFFWTPFLLLAFVGYPALYAKSRPLFWLCYAVPLVQVMLISGYYTISAGETLGSRLLAPILPLLVLPAGIGAAKIPRIAFLLAIASVAMTGIATFVNAQLPPDVENPFFNFYIRQSLVGNFTHNVGAALGLRKHWSIAPLIVLVSTGFWYMWHRCAPICDEQARSTGASGTVPERS